MTTVFTLFRVAPLAALAALTLAASLTVSQAVAEEPVRFATDVLPILSSNCFACHGYDASTREADLRLDVEAEAKREHSDGTPVVPGDPAASTLLQRILSSDPDSKMPPPDSHKTLTAEQIQTLQTWIEQGATWEQHWAFAPLIKPSGSLDDQVQARLQAAGLDWNSPASPHELARRVALDLTGLPPSLEEADAFAAEPTAENYERFVDSLLQSPQFGEHWARMWLDLARYADTKGYEKDLGRTMWPYRDWVIEAFNTDMPLDRFTVEQLAGDLLPDATDSQRIATAFHRNTMSNDEGGTDDEEFRIAAVKDRIDTTMQIWMGLTMGCAKCHSHKYDPISIQDYYRFYAIFNQTADADRYDDAPLFNVLSDEHLATRERLTRVIDEQQAAVDQALMESQQNSETGPWKSANVVAASSRSGAELNTTETRSVLVSGTTTEEDVYTLELELAPGTHTTLRLEALTHTYSDGQQGLGRNSNDPNFVLSELTVERLGESPVALALINPRADFEQNGWPVTAAIDQDPKTGWAVSPRQRERHVALFELSEPLELSEPTRIRIVMAQHYGNSLVFGHFRWSTSAEPAESLTPDSESPAVQQARARLAQTQQELRALNESVPRLPVMQELSEANRRQTHVHVRGNFLEPGESVQPAVLSSFHSLPEGAEPNRLGVARWLVSPENPLTPRVWANRIWSRVMGEGIVLTEEDFGALGNAPTQPQLLDWLAADYRDNGYSLKHLLKQIVMSRAYQQSSVPNARALEIDPRNELISRAPRYRLSAEAVRDQALRASGLLSLKLGGPSVMPPQPEGLWRSTYNGMNWIDAEGEDRYRRGIYTYLKRTTPYPSFINFDGGSGEVCMIRRIRTNTPLQALVTLNDPVYLEAAAALARRMIAEESETSARAARGLRLALIRPLRQSEAQPLIELFESVREEYRAQPAQARALIESCRGSESSLDDPDFAAWIVVANTILNLDEVLCRR